MFPLINDEGIVEPDCWKISNYETKGPGHSHQWQVTAQYYVPPDGSVLEKTSHLSEIKPHDRSKFKIPEMQQAFEVLGTVVKTPLLTTVYAILVLLTRLDCFSTKPSCLKHGNLDFSTWHVLEASRHTLTGLLLQKPLTLLSFQQCYLFPLQDIPPTRVLDGVGEASFPGQIRGGATQAPVSAWHLFWGPPGRVPKLRQYLMLCYLQF